MISTTFVFIFVVLYAVTTPQPTHQPHNYNYSDEWGNCSRVLLYGYTYDYAQAMEPFLSRDGKYLFWNSVNTGSNTSLHYGFLLNATSVRYLGELGGQANGIIPHLDAVPAMTDNNDFYWVSTRNYPQDIENLQHGTFDPRYGTVPIATPVHGDFYIKEPGEIWIVMDQEINRDNSLLFYVNAHFADPPGPLPIFSNISLAVRNADGSFTEHQNAIEIMRTVNNVVAPTYLRYGPSSLGTDGLELYFTVRTGEEVVSALFVAKRDSRESPFGIPERIVIKSQSTEYLEPEAPTLSADGSLLMFSRIDCPIKVGCTRLYIYSMPRQTRDARVTK